MLKVIVGFCGGLRKAKCACKISVRRREKKFFLEKNSSSIFLYFLEKSGVMVRKKNTESKHLDKTEYTV